MDLADTQDLSTVAGIVQKVTEQFKQSSITYAHGTDNAYDEACYLIFGILDLDHNNLEKAREREVTVNERSQIDRFVSKRIKKKIPTAYLLNKAWFCGLRFYVDERVLIPRSPIAELIKNEFKPWVKNNGFFKAADLGTGSGCIAIALAKIFPEIHIDAIDVSRKALEVASINVKAYQCEDQITLVESDFFNFLDPTCDQLRYDLIISNPPYVDVSEMRILPDEFLHEPSVGLEAGKDGLESVIKILCVATNFLNNDGLLVVEVGKSQDILESMFPEITFTWIEFKYGGSGVFVFTKQELDYYSKLFFDNSG